MTHPTEHNAAVGRLLLAAANLHLSGTHPDPVDAVISAADRCGFQVIMDAVLVARNPQHWERVCDQATARSRETMTHVGEVLRG